MAVKLRENAVTKLATVTGINAKTVAVTELFVVPTGKTLVVDHVVIRCTSFTSGGKSTQAVASFGGNSATYNDYLTTITFTVAAASVSIARNVLSSAFPVYAAAASFRISVETGSNASVETWSVDLFGYLV